MSKIVRFGLTVSEEILGNTAPVLIQGGLETAIRRAAELGFNSVELHVRNPNDIDVGAVTRSAVNAGVEISAIGTGLEYSLNGLNLTSPDTELRLRTATRFEEHIDLAANFGATVFVGLCRGTADGDETREAYLNRLHDTLIPLAAYAREKEVSLSLEPIAAYMTNLLNTTVESLRFISRPGLESILLLMDTHHMFIEDGDIAETFRLCKGRIGHIHISDSDRKYPGSGEIDFEDVGSALKEIEYSGAVSAEVLPDPDGETAALHALEWMRRVWL
ncbi:MAG: sugar phosphate isomerase/epimerase [Spirochaetales bacterium]|jgi:sugar phosphate isomerase/epimerase|nr:sugar phosphate isomerase/epimerase [Spirochaetales bacterium]